MSNEIASVGHSASPVGTGPGGFPSMAVMDPGGTDEIGDDADTVFVIIIKVLLNTADVVVAVCGTRDTAVEALGFPSRHI